MGKNLRSVPQESRKWFPMRENPWKTLYMYDETFFLKKLSSCNTFSDEEWIKLWTAFMA